MTAAPATSALNFGAATIHRNLSVPRLIEVAIRRGEGVLAANGALMCDTGDRTGRSPKDKFLEDTPGIHDSINWGAVNQPISPDLRPTAGKQPADASLPSAPGYALRRTVTAHGNR